MSADRIIATYKTKAAPPRVAEARCEASARGAMLWTGQLALGHPAYWVTLPAEIAEPLQVLRVVAAVDAALGVRTPRLVKGFA